MIDLLVQKGRLVEIGPTGNTAAPADFNRIATCWRRAANAM